MFAYIKGTVESKSHERAVIDVGGIGYNISIPYSTYTALPEIGEVAKLNTYLAVREDNISLFGFYSKEEMRIFELLISVSGIGPKLALSVLSGITVADFGLAVITDDVNKLTNISGIGKKTAQRMIIELKDKMKKEDLTGEEVQSVTINLKSDEVDEAISALQVLGYSNKDAISMVNLVTKEGMGVQDIIKEALRRKK